VSGAGDADLIIDACQRASISDNRFLKKELLHPRLDCAKNTKILIQIWAGR
jgi:hypothetical protein